MRYSMVVLTLIALVLVGCGNVQLQFWGESEHWRGVLITYDGQGSSFTFTYKREDIDNIGKVKYEFNGPLGEGGSGTARLNGRHSFSTNGNSNEYLNKDQVYRVTIEWNDKKESLELKASD